MSDDVTSRAQRTTARKRRPASGHRPVILILDPSMTDELDRQAVARGYGSRSSLARVIFSDWLSIHSHAQRGAA